MSNIQTHRLHVTHFKDVKAAVAYDQVRSLPEIAGDILGASAPTKKDLPWIKMARFGRKKSQGNSLRHNENVKAFSGIELDYDGEKISFNAALAKFQDLHCRGLIYTSPSHSKAKPRWRLLLPTSKEIWEPDFRRVLVNRVDSFFGRVFAQESFTLSQAYYFGRVKHKPKVRCAVVDGDYIDLRDDLAMFDDPKPPPPDSDMVAAMVRDTGKGVSINASDNVSFAPTSPEELEQEMRAALMVIPSDDYHDWIKVGAAIRDGLGDTGSSLFHEWSQGSPKYDPEECSKKWDKETPKLRRVTVNTIFWFADQHDPEWRELFKQAKAAGVRL